MASRRRVVPIQPLLFSLRNGGEFTCDSQLIDRCCLFRSGFAAGLMPRRRAERCPSSRRGFIAAPSARYGFIVHSAPLDRLWIVSSGNKLSESLEPPS